MGAYLLLGLLLSATAIPVCTIHSMEVIEMEEFIFSENLAGQRCGSFSNVVGKKKENILNVNLITYCFEDADCLGDDKEAKKIYSMIQGLLKGGADPNTINEKDGGFGEGPLHIAGSMHVIELLLEHGADVNKTNSNGETRLHYACRTNVLSERKIIPVLLKNGANPDRKDNAGYTARAYLKTFMKDEKASEILGEPVEYIVE